MWTGELLCEQVSGRAHVTSCSACCSCVHFVRTEWHSVCLHSLSIILAPSSLNLQCLICARSLTTPLQRRHSYLYFHLEWSVSYLCYISHLCTLTWSGRCLTCVISVIFVLSPGEVGILPVLYQSSLYSHLEWSVSYLCCVIHLCTLTWSIQCLTCVISVIFVLSPGVVSVLPVLYQSSLYFHLEWSVSYLCCVIHLCTLTWSGQCLTCVVTWL